MTKQLENEHKSNCEQPPCLEKRWWAQSLNHDFAFSPAVGEIGARGSASASLLESARAAVGNSHDPPQDDMK